MRPWILVCLCCLGLLGGGACSARPLLDIQLTATSGLSTQGYPRITVTRTDGKTPVKEIDKTNGGDPTALFVIGDMMPTDLGVFLPSGTEGDVEVSAEIVAVTGPCDLTCAPKTVNVHGGDVTSVALTLMGDKRDCAATKPDGGVDTTDVPAARDAEEDKPPDAEDFVLACFNYCQDFNTLCMSWITDPTACIRDCENAHWPIGTQDAATGENTFGCRERHLRVTADMSLDCSECYAASPPSPGICAPADDAGTRGPCPVYP